jgi:serine-type D-Ala-D-Ala carboxypeptidase
VSAEAELRALLDDAVASGTSPGLVAVVSAGGVRFEHAAGRTARFEGSPAVGADTVFDLASLTKVLSTTLLCAHAIEVGLLALDEAPWRAWPGVSVKNALLHDGGLLWWAPFHERVPGPVVGLPAGARALLAKVLAAPPTAPPGQQTVYSDLGFIALGALLEERLGDRLDVLFDAAAKDAYGPTGLRYVPLFDEGYHPALPDVAATSLCPWRGRVMQGQVNDDNAFAMGGVAGHAGLFGTARDVEAAARFFLAEARRPRSEGESVLGGFARYDGPRRLGFDRPTEGGTTGGAIGERGFGHLGFTGTSLWLDPDGPGDEGAVYVLLTNRVCESRQSEGIKKLRPAFHRAARRFLEER